MKTEELKVLERRLNQRLAKEASGEFLSKDNFTYGAIQMLDYSHSGLKAKTERQINLGSRIALKVNFKDNSIPAFSTGKVVWLRESSDSQIPQYDIGIHLDEYDGIEEKKTERSSCSNEYLNKVADYAFSCGLLSVDNKEELKKHISFLPGMFITYFFMGAMVSYGNSILTFLYTLSIFFIVMRTLIRNRKGITLPALKEKPGIFAIPQMIKNSAAILLIHICYGMFFIYGFIAGWFRKAIKEIYLKVCTNN